MKKEPKVEFVPVEVEDIATASGDCAPSVKYKSDAQVKCMDKTKEG